MNELDLSDNTQNLVINIIKNSNLRHIPCGIKLKKPQASLIRAGIYGGLPFDNLTTDLINGCLPTSNACYGNCFAAIDSWKNEVDFGQHVANILSHDVFIQDLQKLSNKYSYLRNGWNSDPSWIWANAAALATLICDAKLLPIFITKAFKLPNDLLLNNLVQARAEIRVSISALDTNKQLQNRIKLINNYRAAGGIAIPVLMSTAFKHPELALRQDKIVAWTINNDFPGSENSLRIDLQSPIMSLIDSTKIGHVNKWSSVWSGRIYHEQLVIPALTSLPDNYMGLTSAYLSKLDRNHINSLFVDKIILHDQVIANREKLYFSPKQGGIGKFSANIDNKECIL